MDSYSGKLGGKKKQRGGLRDVVRKGDQLLSVFSSSDPSHAVPRHREGGVRQESVFYLTNFMHLE